MQNTVIDGCGVGGGVILRNPRGTEIDRKEGPWIPKGPQLIHPHLDYQSVLHYREVPTKSKDIRRRWGRSSTKKKHE